MKSTAQQGDDTHRSGSAKSGDSHSSSQGWNHYYSHYQDQGSSELFRSSTRSTSRDSSKNKPHPPASMHPSRNSQIIQEELNLLRFSKLGLYGRDDELKLLEESFENMGVSGSVQLNFVLVSGPTGAGKTALVKEFSSRISKKDPNVIFASGKYDPYLSVPYRAFVSAFSQLCSDIRSHPHFESKIKDAILKAVGDGSYKLLLDIIPNIGELVYEAAATARDRSSSNNGAKIIPVVVDQEYDIVKSKEKFKFLMQRFLQSICQPEHKVVLFLDDIQWIDDASIALLEMILDEESLESSLLIVGTCREEEVTESHIVRKLIHRVQQKRRKTSLTITVPNLTLDAVQAFLADLLNRDPSDVQDLASIAHSRVHGNSFFLLQFLTALRDAGFLRYSVGAMRWTWEGAEIIRKSTVVAENVLDVLVAKLETLPEDAKQILKVVACLDANFDEDLVTLVMTNLKASTSTDSELFLFFDPENATTELAHNNRTPNDILQSLEQEGLLENFEDYYGGRTCRSYCYAHSQVAVAAHALLDPEFMPRLKLDMGRILYQHRSEIDTQSLLFTIVDLWNEGSDLVTTSKEIRILVEMNFEAGTKALESFAFGASCSYLQQAIKFIPEHKRWEEEYDLSLALYNCLIKAEYSMGTWDSVRLHATEVITTPGKPVIDKIVAYKTMITILSIQEHNHNDAIALAVHVLKLLGVPFSLKLGKLAVVGALIKTKRLLSKVPLETLLTSKEMTDDLKHVAMDVISSVNSSLYAANPELLMVAVLKTLRWSLKYGFSRDTAKCIAFYGLVEYALGNAKGGTKACKLAVELAEKKNLMDTEYSPTSSVYGFVLPWTSPLHTCSNRLLAGYNAGLETGDLHYGFMNVTLFAFFCYCTGKPFTSLEADMREYARQMKEYNQVLQLQFLSLTWQTILNLMGQCDGNAVDLTGEVMDYEDMLQIADHDNIPPLRAQVQCHRLELAVYFQDFDLAAQLIGPAGKVSVVNPGNPIIWRNVLFEGIASFELVRRGKKSWAKTAIKALSKTKKWVDTGNVNCVHILYLLQAEKAAILENDTDQARQLFDKAIVTAARNGFRNDRALASERCAAMYAADLDEFWFDDYWTKSVEAYTELEAFGKVDEMNERLLRRRQKLSFVPLFEIKVVEDRTMMATAVGGAAPSEPEAGQVLSDVTSLPTRGTTGVIGLAKLWADGI